MILQYEIFGIIIAYIIIAGIYLSYILYLLGRWAIRRARGEPKKEKKKGWWRWRWYDHVVATYICIIVLIFLLVLMVGLPT
ncbi:MAG: hypothetical protein ACFFFT_00080 [Candidatus Thorarchaeota archaeon]